MEGQVVAVKKFWALGSSRICQILLAVDSSEVREWKFLSLLSIEACEYV